MNNDYPHDLDAEQAVLGAMTHPHRDKDLNELVRSGLKTIDFYGEGNRVIFKAICDLDDQGPIDTTMLNGALKDACRLEEVGGTSYLVNLGNDAVPSCASISRHVERVKALSTRRQKIDLSQRVITAARCGEPDDLFLRGLQMLDELPTVNVRGVEIIDALALSKMELPPLHWIIPGLLPTGLTILGGQVKIGKSWLMLDITLEVARNGNVLGHGVEFAEVLYLALEDGPRRLQDRMGKLLPNGHNPPDSLNFAMDWPYLTAGGFEQLDNYLSSNRDVRLVCLDTTGRLICEDSANKNAYQGSVNLYGKLQGLALKQDVAIVCVDHLKKSIEADALNRIQGSVGKTGSADASWVLSRSRGQADAELLVTGRDLLEQELALRWEPATCRWSLLGDLHEFRETGLQGDILECLRTSDATKPNDIAALLDASYNSVVKSLSRLTDKGTVIKVRRGEYGLARCENVVTGNFRGDA